MEAGATVVLEGIAPSMPGLHPRHGSDGALPSMLLTHPNLWARMTNDENGTPRRIVIPLRQAQGPEPAEGLVEGRGKRPG